MDVVVRPDGRVVAVYTEALELRALGTTTIRRASHIEPDVNGSWWADLAPVGGPKLGPYDLRSAALAAESSWLGDHLAALPHP